MTIKAISGDTLEFRQGMGAEVRSWIARRRMTAGEVAAAIHLTPTALSRRLTGKIAFDIDDLVALARVLGCDIADFLPEHELHRRQLPTSVSDLVTYRERQQIGRADVGALPRLGDAGEGLIGRYGSPFLAAVA